MKHFVSAFFTLALLFSCLGSIAYASLTEVQGTAATFSGCDAAKAQALQDLGYRCNDGRIEGISCENTGEANTDRGQFCSYKCTAYCIPDAQRDCSH